MAFVELVPGERVQTLYTERILAKYSLYYSSFKLNLLQFLKILILSL
jgi:hypothetical protein